MSAFTFLLDPRVWAALAIALVVGAAGGYFQGRGDGRELEASAWNAREAQQAAAHAAQIKQLNEKARAAEAANAAYLAAIGENHAQEMADQEALRRRDVANARSGALRLRINGACPVRAGAGGSPEAGTPAGDRHDATTAELPREVTADLLELVDDADAAVKQLTACQAVVRSDRAPGGSAPRRGEP